VCLRHELDGSDFAVGKTIGRVVAIVGAQTAVEVGFGAGRVVASVVNAQTEKNEGFDLSAAAPSLLETVGLISRAQIRRTNSDTLDFMTEEVSRWASDLATAGNPVKGHLVEVSFDHLGDTERRDYLEKIPTNFSLSDEQVDRLIEAGRTLLRESPSFKAAIEGLR
jgi:NTE family protein